MVLALELLLKKWRTLCVLGGRERGGRDEVGFWKLWLRSFWYSILEIRNDLSSRVVLLEGELAVQWANERLYRPVDDDGIDSGMLRSHAPH